MANPKRDDNHILLCCIGQARPNRPAKRQKIDGLNSRYDDMIRTVNIMQASSSSSSRSTLSRRQRAASSSSTTTHDTPTTPVDVSPRGLPERISVARMKRSKDSIKDLDPFDPSVWSNHSGQHLSNDRSEFVPTWLQGAISTLDFRHPLRSLLPEETRDSVLDDAESPALGSLSDVDAGTEESPFAFSAPTKASAPCVQTNTANYSGFDQASLTQSYRLEAGTHEYGDTDSRGLQLHPGRSPPLPLLHPSIGDYEATSSMLPFSTPGPVSDFETHTLVPSRTISVLEHHPLDDPAFQLETDLPASPLSGKPRMPLPLQRITTSSELTLPAASSFMPMDEGQPHHSVLLATVDPSQSLLPFSTPGPTAAFRSSSSKTSPPTPARHQWLDAFGTRSFSPIHATAKSELRLDFLRQPHFVRVQSRLTSHSPRSSSVERFLTHEDAHESSTRDRLSSPLHSHTEDDINYEALGFTWKKFDRGDIILDASSSSPLRAGKSDSEDLFWGTPVVLEPDHATHTLLTPVIHPSGQSSPASLRLADVSTPIHSPLKQPSHSLYCDASYTTVGPPLHGQDVHVKSPYCLPLVTGQPAGMLQSMPRHLLFGDFILRQTSQIPLISNNAAILLPVTILPIPTTVCRERTHQKCAILRLCPGNHSLLPLESTSRLCGIDRTRRSRALSGRRTWNWTLSSWTLTKGTEFPLRILRGCPRTCVLVGM
ncbi:hypothetical protein C8Q74DRAFT_750890 [Fomes fomentarius]|nr:hypothetical protein C8Q74DRAFT_750890 [Fomes fomentarius]